MHLWLIRHGHCGSDSPDTKSIISDLLDGVIRSARFISECEHCGRVFIQKHSEYGKNVHGAYVPEEDIRNVLQSQRKHPICYCFIVI